MTNYPVNLIGKIFGSIKGIEVSNNIISLIGRETYKVKITDLIVPPRQLNGFLGSTLVFTNTVGQSQIRFLSPKNANSALSEIERLLVDLATNRIESTHEFFEINCIENYLRDSRIDELDKQIKRLIDLYGAIKDKLRKPDFEKLNVISSLYPLEKNAESVRNKYIKARLERRKDFFDAIESNPLTYQQREACVKDNDRNLILAAAGTGKTSVMVAKALDLIDSSVAQSDEILILAYNKAATVELDERVKARAVGADISESKIPEINTFHALGRKILMQAGVKPTLSKFSEDKLKFQLWASEWFAAQIKERPEFLKDIIDLMVIPVNVFGFKTQAEYDEYIRDNEYRTLQFERVKGYQELLIANWFFLNSIEYEYEAQYITKRRVEVEFDYKPDFFLKNHHIYLEHFGIDRQKNTAPWIDKADYNAIIEKKRLLHMEMGTTLIETYHYDWIEDNLENRLHQLMEEHGVEIKPKSTEEIFDHLNEKKIFPEIVQHYLKCLEAIRVERLDDEDIVERLNKHGVPNAERYQSVLSAFHDAYKKVLLDRREIDFDDMIIRATEEVESGNFEPPWKYILVDEFQDISMARMRLVQSLVEQGPEPILTVVGDDWQSIYRFSGGKLELTTRFGELVGSHSMTKLEKTFRYNSSIAHTAGTFIMENPEQYKKNVITEKVSDSSQVYLLDSKVDNDNQLEIRAGQIVRKIIENDPDAKIAILARYNYLLKDTREHFKNIGIANDIHFWTFHSSKGLEADYCVLIGFFQGKSGFPNRNKEQLVIEALLPSLDAYEHSEERRLLYVAMTRARKKCYILADPIAPSEFVIELLSPKFNLHIASESFEAIYREIFKCPMCTHGSFRLLESKFGPFYRCTTGPSCPSKPRVCLKCGSPSLDVFGKSVCNNPSCRNELKICPVCARPMKRRSGRYGDFWGCSGYGVTNDQCTHTEKIYS